MFFLNKKNKQGFTLIELLVVISIIGILSSLSMLSLNSSRAKARDALRKADLAQMRTALVLYSMDHNDQYPICGTYDISGPPYGATVGDSDGDGSWCYINTLATALTSGERPIVQEIPRDPMNKDNLASVNSTYIYRYVSDGSQYAIAYNLEDGGGVLQIIRGW